jgi:hypothetical protein
MRPSSRLVGMARWKALGKHVPAFGSLNMLRDRGRRPQEVPPMAEPPEPTRRTDPIWLEPYPDVLLDGVADT